MIVTVKVAGVSWLLDDDITDMALKDVIFLGKSSYDSPRRVMDYK